MSERPSSEDARRGGRHAPARGRVTFALRRCCRCERVLGVRVWPWNGRRLVTTHGLCAPCEARALEELAEARPRPCGGGESPS